MSTVFGSADKSSHDSGRRQGPQREHLGPGGIPGLEELKPRGFRSRADELKYFAVSTSCLQCRKTVQAPVDKLHYKLRCPHCGMLMHLREDGKWYPGVHPSLQSPQERTRAPWTTRLLEGWRRLSPRRRRGVLLGAATIAVGIIVLGVLQWGRSQSEVVPASIEEQAAHAVQALLTGDDSQWDGLIAEGTERPAREWIAAIRDRIRIAGSEGRPVEAVELEVLFVNWKDRQAAVAAEFRCSRETVECVLIWMLDGDNHWRLNGRKTLDDLRATAPPAPLTRTDDDKELEP